MIMMVGVGKSGANECGGVGDEVVTSFVDLELEIFCATAN